MGLTNFLSVNLRRLAAGAGTLRALSATASGIPYSVDQIAAISQLWLTQASDSEPTIPVFIWSRTEYDSEVSKWCTSNYYLFMWRFYEFGATPNPPTHGTSAHTDVDQGSDFRVYGDVKGLTVQLNAQSVWPQSYHLGTGRSFVQLLVRDPQTYKAYPVLSVLFKINFAEFGGLQLGSPA